MSASQRNILKDYNSVMVNFFGNSILMFNAICFYKYFNLMFALFVYFTFNIFFFQSIYDQKEDHIILGILFFMLAHIGY